MEGANTYAVQFTLDGTFGDDTSVRIVLEPTFTERYGPSRRVTVRVAAAYGTAVDIAVQSPWTTPVTGMTDTPPPDTPMGLRVSETTADSITWTWRAVGLATGYVVQLSTNEAFGDEDDLTVLLPEPTYTVSRLPPLTTRYLRVQAARSVDGPAEVVVRSPWTTPVTGMTDAPPPDTPMGLRVSETTADSITWTWRAVGLATGYVVQLSTNEAFGDEDDLTELVPEPTYTVSRLPPLTTRYLRVQAATSVDGPAEVVVRSPWTTHVTGMTGAATLAWTNVPDELELEVGETQEIHMTLTPAVDADYTVESVRSRVRVTESGLSGGVLRVTLRGESAGGDTVRLTATAPGYERAEASVSVEVLRPLIEPPEPPANPTGLSISDVGIDFLEWTWDPVEGATSYEVSRFNPDSPPSFPYIYLDNPEPLHRWEGLPPNERVGINVRAVAENAAGRAVSDLIGPTSGWTLPPRFTPSPLFLDPRFDRDFWQQLAFNTHDCPTDLVCAGGPLDKRRLRVLRHIPSFYIETHDDSGTPTFSGSEIAAMRRIIPPAVEALTGMPYTGEIREGARPTRGSIREGWVRVGQDPHLDRACGVGSVGEPAGVIKMPAPGAREGWEDCRFEPNFAHEIGHVMGFWHVSEPTDLMHKYGGGDWFSPREVFHARLAYEIGRGHPYVDDRSGFFSTDEYDDELMPEPPTIVCPLRH